MPNILRDNRLRRYVRSALQRRFSRWRQTSSVIGCTDYNTVSIRLNSTSTVSNPDDEEKKRQGSNAETVSSTEREVYDVVIVGGGVVGSSLALSLLQGQYPKGPIKIALVESSSLDTSLAEANLTKCLQRPLPDLRVYALSPSSIAFLSEIGVWKGIVEARSQSYTKMQVWESEGPGFIRFSSPGTGKGVNDDREESREEQEITSELGRIVEDSTLQAALFSRLGSIITSSSSKAHHDFDLYSGSQLTEFSVPHSGSSRNSRAVPIAQLTVQNKEGEKTQLRARLVVGADGANSMVRKLSGIPTWGWGYGQEAIVCTVQIDAKEGAVNDTAWQRYIPTGPVALLPLWDGYSSVVWSTSVAEAKRLTVLDEQSFQQELNEALSSPNRVDRWTSLGADTARCQNTQKHTDYSSSSSSTFNPLASLVRLAKGEVAGVMDTLMSAAREVSGRSKSDRYEPPPSVLRIVSSRARFPLSFQKAKSYTADRVALIGDAAHSIHPQAGQGLNLGIADAKELSSTIKKGLMTGTDIGDRKHLAESYGRHQYLHNICVMGTVDVLNTVYRADSKATSLLRSAGMLGLHAMRPVKDMIAGLAMGKK